MKSIITRFIFLGVLAGLFDDCLSFQVAPKWRATRTVSQYDDMRLSRRSLHNQQQSKATAAKSTQLNVALPESVGTLASSLFSTTGPVPFIEAFGINAVLFAGLSSKLFTMLTPTGFAHALALGTMLWTTLGWKGWIYCVAYLAFGQLVTKVRFAEKEKAGIAEKRGGRRGPENVWGSAATGLICAACAVQGDGFLGFSSDLFVLGYVASLATKLADTFASEIGKAYGKTTFLITTLERVEPGTEGAVSAEGTAAAAVGGLILSAFGYGLGFINSVPAVLISTLAAFVATNVESLLGATLQEKEGLEWITNEVINWILTVIGAALAMSMGILVLGMS